MDAFGYQPHQPIMTTEHNQYQKCLIFSEGGKPDGLENPRGTAESQRTTKLTYGPGRESNRGHLGERWALYAQANRATKSLRLIKEETYLFTDEVSSDTDQIKYCVHIPRVVYGKLFC